ncbi:hypothetical protein LINPERHAP2_LOCUS18520, partial [Linum perenne]
PILLRAKPTLLRAKPNLLTCSRHRVRLSSPSSSIILTVESYLSSPLFELRNPICSSIQSTCRCEDRFKVGASTNHDSRSFTRSKLISIGSHLQTRPCSPIYSVELIQ